MASPEKSKKVTAALTDLKKLYRKHGFEVVRAAMSRYLMALREKNSAEKAIKEAQEKLSKAEKRL